MTDDILGMNAQGISTIPLQVTRPLMSHDDERRALDGLQKLDAQAVSAVYDQYFPEIYRYVYYRLGDQAAAEDIASDVFVRLLEAVQNRRGPQSNIKGWLIGTASHVVADHLRQRYRRPVEAIPDEQADHQPGPPAEFDLREQSRSVRRPMPN